MTATVWRRETSTFAATAAYPTFLAEGRGDCATHPTPDDFTEDGDLVVQRLARERARTVCYGCRFIVDCRNWAIEHGAQGVYGATTTAERRHRAARA